MLNLICGDALEELRKLPDESFDLIVCDPPYNNVVNESWDKIKDYYSFSHNWITQCRRLLKNTGSIYIFCSIGPNSSSLLDIASILREYYYFQDMVVWSKQRGRGNRKGWLFTREEILWATKDKKNYVWNKDGQYSTDKYHESWIKRLGKENNPFKRATNVWKDIEEVSIEMARVSGGRGKRESYHPTQKPVALLERIILAHTRPGDLVLDCFAGSGTTGVAALKNGRACTLIEKDASYCEVIKERILNETNR